MPSHIPSSPFPRGGRPLRAWLETGLSLPAALVLALGILPSFTALSRSLADQLPSIARYIGPWNPMKIGAPILVLQLWVAGNRIPKGVRRAGWVLLALGTISTLITAYPCGWPPSHLREWAAMVMGCLGAAAWLTLPATLQRGVLTFWLAVVAAAVAVDAVSPYTIDRALHHLFDPETRKWDVEELGQRALGGFWGRQSVAKLLSWLPWLAGFAWLSRPSQNPGARRVAWIAWGGLTILAAAAILGTSQRGGFVAIFAGGLALALHFWLRGGNRRAIGVALIAGFMAFGLALVLVPRSLWQPRLQTLIGAPAPSAEWTATVADANKNFRIRMTAFSLGYIARHPLGNACIYEGEFFNADVHPATHSHSLWLEQLRSRGWAWGLAHLLVWLWAGWVAWWGRGTASGFAFAAWTSVVVGGLVDHPWFVIHQAVVLGVILVSTRALGAGKLGPR